jgi:acetyl-CoA carboxylase carboxyl transferase subunit beta
MLSASLDQRSISGNRWCTLHGGDQRAEFLLEHGAIDMIVDRRQMRDKLATLISAMQRAPAVA